MELELVVLRSRDIQLLRNFYTLLGLTFKTEKHGKGPEHFSAQIGPMVLELYPFSEKYPNADMVRLGFNVQDLPTTILHLEAHGLTVRRVSRQAPDTPLAFVKDPDGRTIELYQA